MPHNAAFDGIARTCFLDPERTDRKCCNSLGEIEMNMQMASTVLVDVALNIPGKTDLAFKAIGTGFTLPYRHLAHAV
jgi:hypothetical protein